MDFDRLYALNGRTLEEFDQIKAGILALAGGETEGGHMKGSKGKYIFTISEYENTDCLHIWLGGEEAYIPMRDIYDAANEHKEYLAAKARIDAMPEEERIAKEKIPTANSKGGHMPNVEELVFQSLGEASMCWSETPKGVFDSGHAKEVGERLVADIKHFYATENAPMPTSTTTPKFTIRGMKMPNPTEEQTQDPLFLAIWEVIKTWDVKVPEYYWGYCEANGSHVMLIFNALHQLWRSQ